MSNQKSKLDISTLFGKGATNLSAPFHKRCSGMEARTGEWHLAFILVVAILLLIGGSYYAYSVGVWWLIPLYAILVGLWVVMAILPRAPYTLRAGSLLILIYAVSILDLFESGRTGSARVFLIALPVLGLLLFDVRAGVLTLVVSLLTLAAFGWLYATTRLSVSPEVANSTSPVIWLSNSVVFFFITVLLMTSANYLINRLVKVVINLETSIKETERLLSLQQAVFDSAAEEFWRLTRWQDNDV